MTHDLHGFDCGGPAVVVTRGALVESEHCICYAIADARGSVVESRGDIERLVYLRSSAKPLIATAVVASGAADRFSFSPEEIALAAASHSGEPTHVQTALRMLAACGLDETALRCGAHAPVHEPSAEALVAAGQRPRAIHNNCSGKHAGILALAVHRGAATDSYLEVENPAQQEILAVCSELLGLPLEQMGIGVDGCGIPVIAAPLRIVATFFARLSDPKPYFPRLASAIHRVIAAMVEHPHMVAGTNRFDTDIMRVAAGGIVAKGGAEGYHASAALERGLGMAAKVADGNYRAIAPFVINRWRTLGVLDAGSVDALASYASPELHNHAGRVVGQIQVLDRV